MKVENLGKLPVGSYRWWQKPNRTNPPVQAPAQNRVNITQVAQGPAYYLGIFSRMDFPHPLWTMRKWPGLRQISQVSIKDLKMTLEE